MPDIPAVEAAPLTFSSRLKTLALFYIGQRPRYTFVLLFHFGSFMEPVGYFLEPFAGNFFDS